MTKPSSSRALFAISSLGLGHATRTLVVLRDYLRSGYHITVVSTGNTLAFLRLELDAETRVDFIDMPDYPPLERGRGWRLYAYLLLDLARTWWLIRREHRALDRIAGDYDFIFSDGRYGFHSRRTPSFILSHQIAFVAPRGLGWSTGITTRFNIATFRRFDSLFVADFPDAYKCLAGKLAHVAALARCEHRHVGILSSYQHLGLERDIDYLFVISGYLVEHKDSFVRNLLEQARSLPGRKVFVLGNASEDPRAHDAYRSPDLQIHGVASGGLRQQLFARARCVVSRAGYTTVMDLVEHDKQALLIPTPNQTEQEYLARWLGQGKWFVTRGQAGTFDLGEALDAVRETRVFVPPWRTQESVRRIRERIDEQVRRRFISVVVPAHEDERQLDAALRAVLAQRYADDRMEVLVVHQGRGEVPPAVAGCLARLPEARGRVRVLAGCTGGPGGGNAALQALSAQSEWVVLCAADTRLAPNFLHELNTCLGRRAKDAAVVGTCGTQAITVARTDVARSVGFRVGRGGDDMPGFVRDCRGHGRRFTFATDQAARAAARGAIPEIMRRCMRWLAGVRPPARPNGSWLPDLRR